MGDKNEEYPGPERRANSVKLEHRLTKIEGQQTHYDESQKTIMHSMSGLHKRFTDVEDRLCNKVKDMGEKVEVNSKDIEKLRKRPKKILAAILQVLAAMGTIATIVFIGFRIVIWLMNR